MPLSGLRPTMPLCGHPPDHAAFSSVMPMIDGDGGDLDRTRRLGWACFERAARREITRHGGQKPCLRIARNLLTALADPAGVLAHRRGVVERIGFVLDDWALDRERLATTEAQTTGVLNDLELTTPGTSISGLSAGEAAAIRAETSDPHRFTARTMVTTDAAPTRSLTQNS